MDPSTLRDRPWFDKLGYPFESHVLQTANGRLHYLDEGHGPAVLLVHGTPSWSYEYRAQVVRLRERYRVIVPDHLGFGFSDRPAEFPYTLAGHTANLEALLAHLELPELSLVVHDFGGPIGLPLALGESTHVARLVLMNTWLWPLRDNPEFEKQLWAVKSGLMRWLYRNLNFSARVIVKSAWGKRVPLTPSHHQQYKGMFPDRASRVGTLGFLRATYAEDDQLRALYAQRAKLQDRPALILWGMADTFIPAAFHLNRWREVLPNAIVHELADVGHFPQDEAAQEMTGALETFLAGR